MLVISGLVVNVFGQAPDTAKVKPTSHFEEFINELKRRAASYSITTSQAGLRTRECSNVNISPWRYDGNSPNTIFKYPHIGNVGIGVCEPLAKLHIAADVSDSIYFLISDFEADDPSLPGGILKHRFSVKKSNYKGQANVGVNTDDPATSLDIVGHSLRLGANKKILSGTEYLIGLDDVGNKIYSYAIGEFYTSSFGDFYITSGGNYFINKNDHPVIFGSGKINVAVKGKLGIGMTPSKSLDVNGTARVGWGNGHIELFYDGANGVIEYINNSQPYSKLLINYYSDKNVVIGRTNAELVVAGKLGVGTSPGNAPGYRMVVCGKIKSTELRVEPPGWCDYKFKEGYTPRPFSETVKYYRTNHHLPGVPSEEEITKNGMHVGEVSKALLSNLEDAYLYIEQLEKRVSELERKVDILIEVLNSRDKN